MYSVMSSSRLGRAASNSRRLVGRRRAVCAPGRPYQAAQNASTLTSSTRSDRRLGAALWLNCAGRASRVTGRLRRTTSPESSALGQPSMAIPSSVDPAVGGSADTLICASKRLAPDLGNRRDSSSPCRCRSRAASRNWWSVIRFCSATRQNRCWAKSGIATEESRMNSLSSMKGSVRPRAGGRSVWNGED